MLRRWIVVTLFVTLSWPRQCVPNEVVHMVSYRVTLVVSFMVDTSSPYASLVACGGAQLFAVIRTLW